VVLTRPAVLKIGGGTEGDISIDARIAVARILNEAEWVCCDLAFALFFNGLAGATRVFT
jgi:hypothetical protein